MMYYSQPLALKNINKYNRFHGVYRVIDAQFTDLLDGFFFHLTLSDGESQVKMSTGNSQIDGNDFLIGAFVYIEAAKPSNSVWRITKCKLASSKLALESMGFTFDQERYEKAQGQSIGELLNEVHSSKLSLLISAAEERMFDKIKAGVTFDDWLKWSVAAFLANVVSIKFDSVEERDYAIVIGAVYALFINCVGPTKRFDMAVKEDMTFMTLFDEITQFLGKNFPDFGEAFNTVIAEVDPLTVAASKLNNERYISAIQITACQAVECFAREVQEELAAA
jgi:hypothetical protein